MKKAKPIGSLRLFAAMMALVLAMGLAPMLAFAAQDGSDSLVAGSTDVSTAADPIDVHVTISNAGTLVLAYEKVTVTDRDGDGAFTFDEALQAAHDKFCKGGYASSGGWVTKLWGVETYNTGYANNDVVLSMGVSEAVKAGDDLVAIILEDGTDYSDRIAYFDVKTATVMAGKTLKLNLKATTVMNMTQTVKALPNIQVGTWADGKFTALKDTTTDSNGNVKLSFKNPGTYVVSASGTINDEIADWNTAKKDCPISGPVCIVKVTKADPKAKVVKKKTVKASALKKKSSKFTAIKLTTDGKKTFKVVKADKKKCLTFKNGKVIVKKGTKAGKYTIKVKAFAKPGKVYKRLKAKTYTIKVTVK